VNSLWRIITEIWRAIRFELLSSFGTLLTVVLAMVLPAIVWVASKNLTQTEQELKKGLTINVFLRNELTPENQEQLQSDFLKIPGISGASYISKAAAMAKMGQRFGGEMLQGLDENPLPASFVLTVDQGLFAPGAADSLSVRLAKFPEVDEVVFALDIVNRLSRLIKSIKILGLALSSLVAFAAIFIVANIVRVAISDRKKTVEIMQLVGATRSYILAPFVLLGGLLGIAGATLAMIAVSWFSGYVSVHLMKIVFLDPSEVVAFILSGLLLGMVGAIIATQKYLKI
jgi:cell division transport system permease protein